MRLLLLLLLWHLYPVHPQQTHNYIKRCTLRMPRQAAAPLSGVTGDNAPGSITSCDGKHGSTMDHGPSKARPDCRRRMGVYGGKESGWGRPPLGRHATVAVLRIAWLLTGPTPPTALHCVCFLMQCAMKGHGVEVEIHRTGLRRAWTVHTLHCTKRARSRYANHA